MTGILRGNWEGGDAVLNPQSRSYGQAPPLEFPCPLLCALQSLMVLPISGDGPTCSDPTLVPPPSPRISDRCEICGYQCRQRASLNWHMKKHMAEVQYNFTCERCGKRFEKLDSVKFHALKSHPDHKPT